MLHNLPLHHFCFDSRVKVSNRVQCHSCPDKQLHVHNKSLHAQLASIIASKMDDNAAWFRFKDQLEEHYEILERYHRELGGDYEDSSTSLMSVLQAALEASLEATKAECARVREDCESMLRDMASMRSAMGEGPKFCDDDPFAGHDPQTRIKTPLLDTQKVLRIEHNAAKKSFHERAAKLIALYNKLKQYAKVLPADIVGVSIPLIDAAHPPEDISLHRLGLLDAACARCSQEISRRKRQVQSYGFEITQLWAELAVEPSSTDGLDRTKILESQQNPEALGLSDHVLEQLEVAKIALLEEKSRRKSIIDGLMMEIHSLHRKLKLSDTELRKFSSRVQGLAQPIIDICEQELERLLELKKDHLEDFIKDARETLQDLWASLYINEDDRLDFTPAFTDVFTDASLQAHENEIAKLQERLTTLEPLLSLLRRHMALVKERRELAIQTSDSSRFSRRGYNPMAESKLRTKIESTLPKIEQQLREALHRYEEENLVPFRVWGELYLTEDFEIRKPISRLEPGQSWSVPLNDTLPRPNTTDFARNRPRTPGTSSRPGTTSSPFRSSTRSLSTRSQGSSSTDRMPMRSPVRKLVSHKQGSTSQSVHGATLRERVNTNATTVPSKTKGAGPIKPAARFFGHQPAPRANTRSLSSARAANILPEEHSIRTVPPPGMQKQFIKSSVREILSSSTSSQVSTENWDAYQQVSEEEDEPEAPAPGYVLSKLTTTKSVVSQPCIELSLSSGLRNGQVDSSLQNVPEETSFLDSWGDEGF